jgi:amidohydrolase
MSHPVLNAVEKIQPWLVKTRRTIHMEPELGFEEHNTSRLVAETLEEFGIEMKKEVAKTGVVGLLRTGREGPTLGIRADMDALPIEEENETAYKSRQKGKMHACGHDAHTTMLLGAARVLAMNPNLLEGLGGNVKFLFQPGEEGFAGGRVMVEEGVMDNPPVDMVIAGHINPHIQVGGIGTRSGPTLAAADKFTITLRGAGSHAAHPDLSRDPVLAAAHLVAALQGIASRNVDPFDSVVVSVTCVNAGSAFNIIPEEAIMQGTVRTIRAETRDLVIARMEETIRGIATAFRIEAKLDFVEGYPPLVNNPNATRLIQDAAREVLGEEKIQEYSPSMGAEDFAYMVNARPGAMFRVGGRNEARGIVHGIHTSRFDLDEDALTVGVSVFVQVAREFLAKPERYTT